MSVEPNLDGVGDRLDPLQMTGNNWQVVVRDDDVNTFCVVSFILRRVTGLPHELAEQRMLEVHERGRSVVAQLRTRDDAERMVVTLQVYGLHATVEAAAP